MLLKTLSLAFALLIGAAICSPLAAQDVNYHFLRGNNFSAYKTYTWKRAEDAKYPAEADDQIMMRSIDAQLAKKGLTRTDSDAADLYITYQLAVLDDMAWSSFSHDITWQGGANSFGGFVGATTSSSYIIKRGYLIIDVYDVTKKERVWQAEASKVLHDYMKPDKREKNTQKAMAKIFKKYPPAE